VDLHGDVGRKLELATDLLYRLRNRFAPGGLLHFGQGKWYPGEPLPRWALSCLLAQGRAPLWRRGRAAGAAAPARRWSARALRDELAQALGLSPDYVMPAYEDPWRILRDESNLPLNIDPLPRT
jgi:uncharacterized protein (DUF2126 family)